MSFTLRSLFIVAFGSLFCTAAWGQNTAEGDHPPALLPLASEPAPKIVAYAPLAEPLARGVAIIPFRTENLRIMPVFGTAAAQVSPRLGHLHVTVDHWPGGWAHTSVDPVIVNALAPGPHKVLLEIADPTHKIMTSTTVDFVAPQRKADEQHAH
ncbi:DUF6130 family protein [Dyella choica]|uniref:DUF4399 domain-containing protein n=1 Tax=Dyella choica TaxID=1927959 RepID=A0A3S0PQY0_9GAMM|nr:DUF6130 family protein [Dyella choica]RUL78878.1 hypothetical protein EKH80_03490 [Dyella choica]